MGQYWEIDKASQRVKDEEKQNEVHTRKYWEKEGREGVINTLKCWNIEKDGKSFKEISKD